MRRRIADISAGPPADTIHVPTTPMQCAFTRSAGSRPNPYRPVSRRTGDEGCRGRYRAVPYPRRVPIEYACGAPRLGREHTQSRVAMSSKHAGLLCTKDHTPGSADREMVVEHVDALDICPMTFYPADQRVRHSLCLVIPQQPSPHQHRRRCESNLHARRDRPGRPSLLPRSMDLPSRCLPQQLQQPPRRHRYLLQHPLTRPRSSVRSRPKPRSTSHFARTHLGQFPPHRNQLLPLRPDSSPVAHGGGVMHCRRRGEVAQVVEIVWDGLVVLERFQSFLQQVERFLGFP